MQPVLVLGIPFLPLFTSATSFLDSSISGVVSLSTLSGGEAPDEDFAGGAIDFIVSGLYVIEQLPLRSSLQLIPLMMVLNVFCDDQ